MLDSLRKRDRARALEQWAPLATALAFYGNAHGGKSAGEALPTHKRFSPREFIPPALLPKQRVVDEKAEALPGVEPLVAEGFVRAKELGLIPEDLWAARLAPTWRQMVMTACRFADKE